MITPVNELTIPTRGKYADGFPKGYGPENNGATHYIMDKAGETATPAVKQGLYMYDGEGAGNWIYQGDDES